MGHVDWGTPLAEVKLSDGDFKVMGVLGSVGDLDKENRLVWLVIVSSLYYSPDAVPRASSFWRPQIGLPSTRPTLNFLWSIQGNVHDNDKEGIFLDQFGSHPSCVIDS